MTHIELEVGGYILHLHAQDGRTTLHWPLKPFERFVVTSDASPDITFTIHVVKDLPDLEHGPPVFDACHGLWKLYDADSGLVLEAADTKSLEPRSKASITPDYSQVEVWLREKRSRGRLGWLPMHVVNPIAEVCLLTRLARDGGLLLHASGAVLEGECLVFTGPSGAGKSTLADLFASRGATVLSDERVILRSLEGELHAFGSPWVGTSALAENSSARLSRLFCIRHGSGNHALRPIEPLVLSQLLLEQCFLPHWDRAAMSGVLGALAQLIEQVECAEFAFLKTPDVVAYLQQHCAATVAS